jgi:hypothetical protein
VRIGHSAQQDGLAEIPEITLAVPHQCVQEKLQLDFGQRFPPQVHRSDVS